MQERKEEDIIAVAKFMDMEPAYSGGEIAGYFDNTGRMVILGDYRPHEDWNELMAVVEKVNSICEEKGRELSNHSRDQKDLPDPLENPLHWKSWSYHWIHLSTNKSRVMTSVIKFINWYNTQSSQTTKP